jgi:hypothetical protein
MRCIVHIVHEERDHPHVYRRQVPGLVDRDEDDMITCRELEVGWFGRFDADGQKDRTSTGGGYAEIRSALCYIVQYLIGDPDILDERMIVRSGVHAMPNAYAAFGKKSNHRMISDCSYNPCDCVNVLLLEGIDAAGAFPVLAYMEYSDF